MVSQMKYQSIRNKRWVVEREQIHDGIIGLEICLQGMKRRLKITWVWCKAIICSIIIYRKIILG
jgi:hypothetical protein